MTQLQLPQRSRRLTLRLSEQGRRLIEEARHSRGWTVIDRRWLGAAHKNCNEEPNNGWPLGWEQYENTSPSEGTLKKFRKRKYIRREFFIAFCQAVGVKFDDVVDLDQPVVDLQYPSVIGDFPTDIADTPFYGRGTAIAQLNGWISDRNCRVISVHGRAGMGKTTLVCRAMRQVGSQFDFLIWFSLESSPPLSEVLSQLLPYFSDQTETPTETTIDTSCFLKYLKQFRCLVVFDQWETITLADQPGKYRPGYEDYGDLLYQVCRNHQSCIVALSRMNLEGANFATGAARSVRSLKLEELRYPEDKEFLQGLSGTELELQNVLETYNNPSILKGIAMIVKRFIPNGNVSQFFQEGASEFVYDDVERLMSQEFQYLSALEEKLIYWLAIWKNPISYDCLVKSLNIRFADILRTLNSLESRRSLVNICADEDAGEREYGLDRLTLKYVTQEFVRRNVKELLTAIQNQQIQASDLIISHAFVVGNDQEVNQQQQRRIVRPIVEKLQEHHSPDELRQTLEVLCTSTPAEYALENFNHIFALLESHL